jgi:tRNA_anti-like
MPIAISCPKCSAPQTVADTDTGKTIQCPACQSEFAADPGASAVPSPAPSPSQRRGLWKSIGLIVLLGGAIVVYMVFIRSTPTDFSDPGEMFSARFPNPPEEQVVSEANPLALRWGEHVFKAKSAGKEYSVTILDGVNLGHQEYGPATRDDEITSAAVITMTTADAKQLADRNIDHDGHVMREFVGFQKDEGRLVALRLVAGERCILRMTVAGSGKQDGAIDFLDKAGEFFDGVHLGPAFGPPIVEDPVTVSATELAAAYQADAKAADTQYRDRWLRVAGWVKEIGENRTEFQIDGGKAMIVVRRAPPARMSVPVRRTGDTVTATGKCRGLDPESPNDPRIVLDEAIVLSPPPAK